MIIRRALLADAQAMADILNPIIEKGGTTAYEDPLAPSYFHQLIEAETPRTFIHVAETDEGIQGLQWIEPLDPPEDHIGGIATFAKLATTQTGIGTALITATLQASRDAGFSELVAKIRSDNVGGLAYYGKMGFQDSAIVPAEPLKDGTPVDRIVKRLIL